MSLEIHVYHHFIMPGTPGTEDIMSVLGDKLAPITEALTHLSGSVDALGTRIEAKTADIPTGDELAELDTIKTQIAEIAAKLDGIATDVPAPAPAPEPSA